MKCPVCEKAIKADKSYCTNCGWSIVEDGSVYGTLFGNEQKAEYEERQKLYKKFVKAGAGDAKTPVKPQVDRKSEKKIAELQDELIVAIERRLDAERALEAERKKTAAERDKVTAAESKLEAMTMVADIQKDAAERAEAETVKLREDLKLEQDESTKWKREAEKEKQETKRLKSKKEEAESREVIETVWCSLFGIFLGFFISGQAGTPIPIMEIFWLDFVITMGLIAVGIVIGVFAKILFEVLLVDYFEKMTLDTAIVVSGYITVVFLASLVVLLVKVVLKL